jgi:3-deoxy-D-manno-octulosonic-acid transferase
MMTLYSLAVYLSDAVLRLIAIFHTKIGLMIRGRKASMDRLQNQGINLSGCIWIHSASLGEYEQGLPVIEAIKHRSPEQKIVLSFFSPSGFELKKNLDIVDEVIYLPSDTRAQMNQLYDLLAPDKVILIKYEFWWNMMHIANERRIPIYVISAIFKDSDYFFRPMFKSLLSVLASSRHFFVQDENSLEILDRHGIKQASVVGDTRVDRVAARAMLVDTPNAISDYLQHRKVIVYGSVWPEDMQVVKACLAHTDDGYFHIIAPHDVSKTGVAAIQSSLEERAATYTEGINRDAHILIIDTIGLLSGIYRYARHVYIGGGYGKGIHNTLEPAAYGVPIFYGPKHKKFVEAVAMAKSGGGFVVDDPRTMLDRISVLDSDSTEYETTCRYVKDYIRSSQGATDRIINHIFGA